MPRGIPKDLDAETTERVVRSFLVVRIIRGSLLLVFLAVALAGVEARGWPPGVAIAVGLAMLAQTAVVAAHGRRYAQIGKREERHRTSQ